MAGHCKKENCYPDETGCNLMGCEVLTDCENYEGGVKSVPKDGATDGDEDFFIRAPWTGNSLGLQDLEFLASQSKVTLVGIAGVANAGKTTFLATLYCLLRSGKKIGRYRFAGSLTLYGWENIAWYLSWKRNNDIQFPPHTTSNAGRVPGLLHLCLRDDFGDEKDVVFTDAPGEWFDHWSFNQHDPNAQGAVWIHDNADAFLLFADCEMLAGTELGKARKQIRMVADRIKDDLAGRPLGIIWAKSDIMVDEDVKKQLTTYVNNSGIKNFQQFDTSVRDAGDGSMHNNICAAIGWILERINLEQLILPTVAVAKAEDMFLSRR